MHNPTTNDDTDNFLDILHNLKNHNTMCLTIGPFIIVCKYFLEKIDFSVRAHCEVIRDADVGREEVAHNLAK